MTARRVVAALTVVLLMAVFLALAAAAGDDGPLLAGDQVTFGGDVTVPAGEVRDGDLVTLGGNIRVDGTVTQDVVAIGGNITINGTVGRDVVSVGGSITLGPSASVGRDIAIAGGSLNRDPGAKVGRNVVYGTGREFGRAFGFPAAGAFVGRHDRGFNPFSFAGLAFGLVTAVGILLLALFLLLFFPRQLQVTGATIEQRPLESFALGCGGFIVGLALALLFAITFIFAPVSLGIVTAMTAAWLFGWAAIFIITGQRLLRAGSRAQELVPALLLGGLLLGILANIPFLNILVIGVGGSVALGAVIYSRFGSRSPHLPLVGPGLPVMPPPQPPAPPSATA